MNTPNKREALEGEGMANPLWIPSTSTSEHGNSRRQCDGEEAIHPSVPKLCVQTGPGGAALPATGAVPCHGDKKEPCDVPAAATTHINLFAADDTTKVSPNHHRGAAPLAALPLPCVGCELLRAAVAPRWEHLLSFG